MENTIEEKVTILKGMGFIGENAIRQALELAKNDLNEAVSYLTCEMPMSSFDVTNDVEMDIAGASDNLTPCYPPPYDEAMTGKDSEIHNQNEDDRIDFPYECLVELEGRVFTENWSIPFRKDESLAKCLISSTKLVNEGLLNADDNATKFLDRCMPECFNKLLTSSAVQKWLSDVQEGIYDMLSLFIDLIIARLKHSPLPLSMLQILTTAFDPDCCWNTKNKYRTWQQSYWTGKLGGLDKCYARPPDDERRAVRFVEQRGWMVSLINEFCEKGGLTEIESIMERTTDLDAAQYAALLQPFSVCADWLSRSRVQSTVAPIIERAVTYVRELSDEEFKLKKLSSLSGLLISMKGVCKVMWAEDVTFVDDLRLEVTLRMMKCPHFNAKMNALKEVTRLIDETKLYANESSLDRERLLEWLVDNNVLRISLEGHIDQSQYCDKIRSVVQFIGDKLNGDELTQLWNLQSNASLPVSENIQLIISGAATQFTSEQLDILFQLIHKSWLKEDEKARQQLVAFIGKIGHDSRQGKEVEKVLTLLWDLAHLPKLSPHLVEMALREHHSILSDAYLIKDTLKKQFIIRCIEDIKKDQWVVPALRQFQDISKTIIKYKANKSDRSFLHDLNKSHDLLKLAVHSMVRCHKAAVESSRSQGVELNGNTLVDERYKHSEYVWWHLSFLKYLLKEGDLILNWNRAKEIWDALYANRDACSEDRETCCDWFIRVLSDLEQEAVKMLFRERLMKTDVSSTNQCLFECFIKFFESANSMKKFQSEIVVEKLDLIGISFLWRICLECQSNLVAERAISCLVSYSYTNVSQKLKKDVIQLHYKFLNECYKRLNSCNNLGNGTTVAEAVNIATKSLTATVPDAVLVARRPNHYLTIERLLVVVCTYINNIEAAHNESRSILPHCEFYRGSPISLDVRPENSKSLFTIETHGNETVRFIRRKIANELEVSSDHVQIHINEKAIPLSSDRLLLADCDISSHQVVIVKSISSVTQSMQIDDDISLNNNALHEMEQRLPSVVVLSKLGNRVYDILFQLSDLDQSQITTCVRKLLLLLPTDPRIKRNIETGGLDSDNQSMFSEESQSDSSMSMDADDPCEGVSIESSSSRKPRSFDTLFRVCSPDMNLFRLRYNLEVLSGLLIPVNEEQQRASLEDCASFMHNFIQVGGIQTILSVLQREIVSESVDQFGDPDTRRGCYSVALDIAKHLLCVAFYTEHTPGCVHGSKLTVIGSEAAVSPLKRDSFRVGSFDASATPTKRNRRSVSQSPVVIPHEIPHAAKATVQVMPSDEFSSLIITLVRITWFASACKLDQLTATFDPLAEAGTSFLKGRRWSRESSSSTLSPFRQASTSSVSSAGSVEHMDAPIPSRHFEESGDRTADSLIACQALELLVSCLKLRTSHLECFFDLQYVPEFIIDILTRSADPEVRDCAVEQLYQLSIINTSMKRSPRQRLIQLLAKARVPFWNITTHLRSKTQSLVRNCLQFFTLKCNLLSDCINENEQKACGVDERASSEDEVNWLNDFEIPTSTHYAESSAARYLDNVLLTGHLRLIKILITSPKVNKKEIGSQLIGRILSDFLFPASKLIMDSVAQGRYQQSLTSFQPKCSTDESRLAAFAVLIELCKDCTENLSLVSSELISMHHYPDPTRAKEFDFSPLVCERPEHGLVGLKNGGATCYMNSVLQQLYMVPDIAQLVLSTEVENETVHEDTVLYQLQKVFAHLLHSRLQFHVPSSFWKTFRLWGQEINVREQQDSFEFFTDLTDQIDEYLKSKNMKEIFKGVLRGMFCDQKICEGCPHRYEREEPYFALNLPVKSGSLEDSLRQFIAGEKLEGDNAYFCEKCNEKRSTTKRTCIKSLPPVLTIQLKRFGYDWEAGSSLKFDHHFRFPHEVDMQPYLYDSATRSGRSRHTTEQQLYRLVGIVVHSGQAQAGHYYSIIKDRRGKPLSNPHHGKWYKFNDTTVEEFIMNDQSLEEECFGGTFTSKVYERGIPYDEERVRYWNAYLLFYERVPDLPPPVKGRVSFVKQAQVINSGFSSPEISPPSSPRKVNDIKLSQLTNLIKKGDQRGMFTSQIPSNIMQLVREENLQFMRNRGVYCSDYFNFIRLLVQVNLHCVGSHPAIAVKSLQLAMQFLFRTYFRTKRTMLIDCEQWEDTVASVFTASSPACVWFSTQLHTSNGMAQLVAFLLECPNEVVRSCFAKMLGKALQCLVAPNISKEQRNVSLGPMLPNLLALLNKEVTEHVRKSKEYFELLADFIASQTSACDVFLRHDGLSLLLRFLLGVKATTSLFSGEEKRKEDGSGDATSNILDNDDVVTRRWSSTQSREFHSLHASIIFVLLQVNLKKFRSDPGMAGNPPPNPASIAVKTLAEPTPSVEKLLTGSVRKRYIRELLFAAREISTASTLVTDVILHCCYNNEDFSSCAISVICLEISSVVASELKPILTIFLELLSMEDTLHRQRLNDALERQQHGFLNVIKESQRDDEPKCYQCVKALVQLASRCDSNRQFMLESSSNWSWSVTWLKKKMSEHTWSSQSNRSNESSTSKHFQRTMSAQNTLDQATALLAATKSGSLLENEDTTSAL